jgi:hypothetical protein
MQVPYFISACLLAVASTLFCSCSCEEEFPLDPATVELPLRVTDVSFDTGIFLFFNKRVDTATVIPGKTLTIAGAQFTGFFYWEKDNTVLIIPGCEIYDLKQMYNFEVRLDGNASDGQAVRGTDGSALDGDGDNTGGGDFKQIFEKGNCGGIESLIVTNYQSGTFASFAGPFNINTDSAYFFDISFSYPLNAATAVYGDAIFLESTLTQQRIPGRLEVRDRNTLRFISIEKVSKLRLLPNSNFGYRFIVRSGGTAPLKSVYGATLSSDFVLNVRLI